MAENSSLIDSTTEIGYTPLPNTSAAAQIPSLYELNKGEVHRLIPTIVYLLLISVFGTVGNGIVIHIYRTRYKLSNSQCFILCLSTIDLFSCCVVIPLEVATVLEQYDFQNVWLCKWSRTFNTLGTCSSSIILLFIAVDRYRKVCKPFGWQIKAKTAKVLCVVSVLFGIFVSWPAILVYGKKEFDIPEYNMTGTECSTSDEMSDTSFPFMYTLAFGALFVTGIVVMSVLYCLIGNEVKRHANKMEDLGRSMSVPVTSSVLLARNSGLTSEISPETLRTYEVTYNKENKEKQKSVKSEKHRHSKKYTNKNDDSWVDKKDYELSYTLDSKDKSEISAEKNVTVLNNANEETKPTISSSNNSEIQVKEVTEQGEGNTKPSQSDSDDSGMKVMELCEQVESSKKPSQSDSDDSGIKIITNDAENDDIDIENPKTSEEHSKGDNSEKQPRAYNKENNDFCANTEDIKSEITPTSSEEILPKRPWTARKSISSIGSKISNVIMRMTSITTADHGYRGGTLRKTQFLKQARARKTAFIMFVITLAYILSFVPHLFLMLMRQINASFVDNLSDTSRAVYKFFLRSYFLNCAINPVIYSVCDSRFRSAVKKIFRMCDRVKIDLKD